MRAGGEISSCFDAEIKEGVPMLISSRNYSRFNLVCLSVLGLIATLAFIGFEYGLLRSE